MRYKEEGEHTLIVNPYEQEGERVVMVRNLGDDPLLAGPLARLELRSGIQDASAMGGTDKIVSVHDVVNYVSAMKGLKAGDEILFSVNASNVPNHIARFRSATARDMLATILLTNGLALIAVVVVDRAETPDEGKVLVERLRPMAEALMVTMLDVVVYGLDGRYISMQGEGAVS